MKTNLASDWDENNVRFPVVVQPKIDGVRGLHLTDGLTARSLKKHKNRFTTAIFSHKAFKGLDGEFAGQSETHPQLCRITTSMINTIHGEPWLLWHVFDYVTEKTINLPYYLRLDTLMQYVRELQLEGIPYANRLKIIPHKVVFTMEELLAEDALNIEAGYEGTIIRDLNGKYKSGRSTVKEGGLLRIKRFTDAEAIVTSIEEGTTNNNEAQINELGNTFRSSHQENMSPNGMLGKFICKDETGASIVVSPGKLTHDERRYYFENQAEVIGKIIKFKHFAHGVKDKPRFPTFQCFRSEEDM